MTAKGDGMSPSGPRIRAVRRIADPRFHSSVRQTSEGSRSLQLGRRLMGKNTSDTLPDGELIERYRTLGDDYASYGLKLPQPARNEGYRARESLPEGSRAGLARVGRPHAADRFVRKWLQRRHHALSRGRAVSDEVTVDLLRDLDVSVCPVTLATLTHREQKSSDWSVDRLNNDGAYAKGNFAIMRTHATGAKGAKSMTEVHELSEGESADPGASRDALGTANAVQGPSRPHPRNLVSIRRARVSAHIIPSDYRESY